MITIKEIKGNIMRNTNYECNRKPSHRKLLLSKTTQFVYYSIPKIELNLL